MRRIHWTDAEKKLVAAEFLRLHKLFPTQPKLRTFLDAQQVLPDNRQRRSVFTISAVWQWLGPLVAAVDEKRFVPCGPNAPPEGVKVAEVQYEKRVADQVMDAIEHQAMRESVIASLTLLEIASVFAALVQRSLSPATPASPDVAASTVGPLSQATDTVQVHTLDQAKAVAQEHLQRARRGPDPDAEPIQPPRILVIGLRGEHVNELQNRAGTKYDVTCHKGDGPVVFHEYDYVFICKGWMPVDDYLVSRLSERYGRRVTIHSGDFKSLLDLMRSTRKQGETA